MEYKIRTKKTLIADNDKKFNEGWDISFSIGDVRYIGNIKKIETDRIIINDIEKNKKNIKGEMTILLKDIVPNSCDHVYYG